MLYSLYLNRLPGYDMTASQYVGATPNEGDENKPVHDLTVGVFSNRKKTRLSLFPNELDIEEREELVCTIDRHSIEILWRMREEKINPPGTQILCPRRQDAYFPSYAIQ